MTVLLKHVGALLRVKQWVKNSFVLVPVFFSFNLFDVNILLGSVSAFIYFCFCSSFIYIINDWKDRDLDKLHDKKKYRPFASGDLNFTHLVFSELIISFILILFYCFSNLPTIFFVVAFLYIVNSFAYTYYLKDIPLLELFVVSNGYVLRVFAGVLAISEEASPWLYFCAGSVALCITTFKRRAEWINFSKKTYIRKTLNNYSLNFLDNIINISLSITIISYGLFTISDYAVLKYETNILPLSIVFVLFGLLRLLQINSAAKPEEDPTTMILNDKAIKLCVVSWLFFLLGLFYVF